MSESLQPRGLYSTRLFIHGISQARIMEWVAISFSRGSFRPRNQTPVSCLAGRFFTTESPWKPAKASIKRCALWFFTVFLSQVFIKFLSFSWINIKLSRTWCWCWSCIQALRIFSVTSVTFPCFFDIFNITDTADFTCPMILSLC